MTDNEQKEGGFHLDKGNVDCFPCRCNKKTLHKETKTTKDDEGKTIIKQTENRTSWRVGSGYRNATPDGNDIFKTNMNDKEGVDTVDTGFGSRKATPEERIEKLEAEVKELKKYRQLEHMD